MKLKDAYIIAEDKNPEWEKIEREIRTKPWNSKEVKAAWKKAKNMSDLGPKGIDALKNVDFKNMLKIDGDSNGSAILCHVNYHGGMNDKEMDKFEKMIKDSIGNQYIEDYDWNGIRKISLWIKKDAPVFNTK